jgi:hypothetical protein
MPTDTSVRIQDHFANLTDPRRRKVLCPLVDTMSIVIGAVVC